MKVNHVTKEDQFKVELGCVVTLKNGAQFLIIKDSCSQYRKVNLATMSMDGTATSLLDTLKRSFTNIVCVVPADKVSLNLG